MENKMKEIVYVASLYYGDVIEAELVNGGTMVETKDNKLRHVRHGDNGYFSTLEEGQQFLEEYKNNEKLKAIAYSYGINM